MDAPKAGKLFFDRFCLEFFQQIECLGSQSVNDPHHSFRSNCSALAALTHITRQIEWLGCSMHPFGRDGLHVGAQFAKNWMIGCLCNDSMSRQACEIQEPRFWSTSSWFFQLVCCHPKTGN